jgi:sulfatase maturation enzyme AslB (radical SAM superfamily)
MSHPSSSLRVSNAAGALGAWPFAGSGRQPRLTLNLTHACNMACTYCYAGEKSATPMGAETSRAAIDLALAALAHRGDPPLLIAFFGGEPLIAWAASWIWPSMPSRRRPAPALPSASR